MRRPGLRGRLASDKPLARAARGFLGTGFKHRCAFGGNRWVSLVNEKMR